MRKPLRQGGSRLKVAALKLAALLVPLTLLSVQPPLPAEAAPHHSWPVFTIGDQDGATNDVTMIQYLLCGQGYWVEVDGDFGAQTRRQVRLFQRSHGLPPTGTVDGRTWERLIVPVRRGSHGDAVFAVQAILRQSYQGWGLRLDGDFGARTERVVRAFQRDVGLRSDGVVGQATWMWLTDVDQD